MAAGVKYNLQFRDLPKWGNVWTYELLFPDYTGAVETLVGSGKPLTIVGEGTSNDPFAPLKPKYVTMGIIAHTFQEYLDIFEANSEDVQCKVYKGANLIFHGMVLPEEYYEEWVDEVHVLKITAVDGLTVLKHKDYIPMYESPSYVLTAKGPMEDSRFQGFLSEMAIIRTCLNQLSYGLDYKILDGSDLYEYNMVETTSALRQAFHNRAEFRNEDGYKKCYEVLEEIMLGRCARLVQGRNAIHGLCWMIEPVVQLKEAYTAWVIETDGVVSGTVSIGNFVTITNADGTPLNTFVEQPAGVEITGIPGKIRISSSLSDNNIIKDPYDYVWNDSAFPTAPAPVLNKEGATLDINAMLNPGRFEGLVFNLGWAKMAEDAIINIGFMGNCSIHVKLILTTDDDHIYMYDPSGEDWINDNNDYDIYSFSGTTLTPKQYTTITIPADPVREGRLKLLIQTLIYGFPIHAGDLTLYLNDLSVTFRDDVNIIIGTRFVEKINSNNYTLKQVDIPYCDPAPRQSLHTIGIPSYSYSNTIMIDTGQRLEFAYNWHIRGRAETYFYLDLILQMYDEVYSRNRWRMTGILAGQMDLHSVLIVGSRLFVLDNWSVDAKSGIQSAIMLEIANEEIILITESGVELITESDSYNIQVN